MAINYTVNKDYTGNVQSVTLHEEWGSSREIFCNGKYVSDYDMEFLRSQMEYVYSLDEAEQKVRMCWNIF